MSQQSPYTSSTPENSSLAIVSLVAGILGLSFIPGIASIVAVITGNMAMKEIRASGGSVGGEGLAKVGIILGWVAIALAVVGICCFGVFFIFPFIAAFFGIAIESISLLQGAVLLIV